MDCKKCLLPIDCKRDAFAVCEGSCCRSFHGACVGLSEDTVCCLSQKNIFWLCNDCISAFYEHVQKSFVEQPEPDNSLSKVNTELADLKGKIANIMETLTVISEAQKKQSYPSYQFIPHHSTPNAPDRPPKLHEGSRSDSSHSSSEHSMSTTESVRHRRQEGSFSLFLTNIDGCVTEEEISSMVSRSLGVEENEVINVKKLVPKWKANDTLDYVSFKVQLYDNMKQIALRKESWPSGVMYREFIERPRNFWRPTVCGAMQT